MWNACTPPVTSTEFWFAIISSMSLTRLGLFLRKPKFMQFLGVVNFQYYRTNLVAIGNNVTFSRAREDTHTRARAH